jgi:beta-lactamase class A
MTMITRRQGLLGLGGALAAMRGAAAAAGADLADELRRLEIRSRGRLGVAILDGATGRGVSHCGGERFPMCSTAKLLAAGAVLARVDEGREDLGRRIRFGADDLVTYSPVTKPQAGGSGMTMAALCEAAITQSDNTAANLILAALGGPGGLTAFARRIGDPVTRLDRIEPGLNEAIPGDPRDTTTPDAMAADLRALVLGDVLTKGSREQLTRWLIDNQTGGAKLRAGVPSDWRVGDKTGSGSRGTSNDVAILWPPGRAPIIISVYITDTPASTDESNATIAAVSRAVAASLA